MIDFLWHSTAAWLGIGGAAVAALAAVAWFFPPFRKLAIQIAAGVIAVMAIYAKGASDAKKRERQRQAEAEQRMVKKGNDARRSAEHDLAAGKLRDDEFDRDRR